MARQRWLASMPLAEAKLWLRRWMADERCLNDIFARYWSKACTRILTFPVLVHLISRSLTESG